MRCYVMLDLCYGGMLWWYAMVWHHLLSLPPGEPRPSLAHRGLQAVLELRDGIHQVAPLDGALQIFRRGTGVAVPDGRAGRGE